MKILELRFQNLNSLYGEWVIDFTDPEYVSNGIFALTGPTGAGKSTILDAICLALYGATPRLGKITRSGNEIMSRKTGECYAEVLFASQAGRFRCHWEQRRARKKPGGNLQEQEHQIADADTGKLLETKKSRVGAVIAEKTGMDFDRFTRSILLAQGGFDTFLKADVEKKSRILEQITGTEMYSEISRRVHGRQREEQEKLNLLLAETSGIVILEPDQEKKIQQELEENEKQQSVFLSRIAETDKAVTWLSAIDDLKKELLALGEESRKWNVQMEGFKPERIRLEKALKAASLDGTYATLTALRKQHSDDQNALKRVESQIPELQLLVNREDKNLRDAEQCTLTNKEYFKAAAPLIQKIRLLDQTIAEQAKAISEVLDTCTREGEKIRSLRQAQETEQKKRTAAEKTLEDTKQYLAKHARDEWLVSGLAGVEEQLENLMAGQGELAQKEARLKNARGAVTKASKKRISAERQCILKKQELEEASENLQKAGDALSTLLAGKLLREYRTEKETLFREMALIRKIQALEDHRASLKDGRPCPLCGATDHPFAEGNVPVPHGIEQQIESLTRRISRAEELEGLIRQREQEQIAARIHLNDSEKLETAAANDKKAAETNLAEINNDISQFRPRLTALSLAVSRKLKPLGIQELPESKASAVLDSLKSRLKTWQEQVRQKTEMEKHIAAMDSEVNRLGAVIDTQARTLAEKQETLERLKKEHAAGTESRKTVYGSKNPDAEENRLNAAIAHAEKKEKKARIRNMEIQQELTRAKTHVVSLKQRMEQRDSELKKAEQDFSDQGIPAGFPDEKSFLKARLTHGERQSLATRARELDHGQMELRARQKDRESRLAGQLARKLTDTPLDELESQRKEYENSLKKLQDAAAGLKHRLNENAAARQRMQEKMSVMEAQKKECRRWEKLHALIGSADGKKYRNFAQGVTFELMVHHANQELVKMTDRYLLSHDKQHPLELQVIDDYQAGEIRSTRNLSGGESFIVSLTLALGLSKMASRKVRVDSLFLDEGFGTLDEETLDTALGTICVEGKNQHSDKHNARFRRSKLPVRPWLYIPRYSGDMILFF